MEPLSPAIATMIADLHEKIAKTRVRLAELDEQLEKGESEHISEADVTRTFVRFRSALADIEFKTAGEIDFANCRAS